MLRRIMKRVKLARETMRDYLDYLIDEIRNEERNWTDFNTDELTMIPINKTLKPVKSASYARKARK